VVVIPAHNEHRRLPATLAALDRQTHQPDAVVVVADNCTDGTAQLARDCGATVVETVANHDAKAGALNAALEVLLDGLDDHDTVLAMDADTELDEHFVADARQRLAEDHDETIGGVGGVFYGNGERWKLVRQLQANEYTRYARQLARRRGRALVLTGTGTLFRVKALRQVVAARRSGALPDPGGTAGVYDTGALTEDNELTLALKHLGWRARSPRDCIVHTAMMPTWRQLFTQRRRWQRGALENLAHHGIHRHTWPYALRQIGTYLGVLFIPLYVATLATALITGRGVAFVVPLWITVAVVYVVEQTWSVRHGGWRAMLVSVTVIPELIYTLFLNTVYTVCLVGLLAGTAERWGRGVDQAHAQAQAQAQAQAHAQAQANGTSGFGRRRGPHIAVRAPATGAGMTFVTAAIVGLPIVDIALAWDLLAIFVLTGFAFTVVRLVPVPTS
jgi:cellulose synthase/poly-beta-1,6-N-acetylglucosamine synthase-like glycosyltransferase